MVMGRVDIITSTLGKALGGALGGFTSGKKELSTCFVSVLVRICSQILWLQNCRSGYLKVPRYAF